MVTLKFDFGQGNLFPGLEAPQSVFALCYVLCLSSEFEHWSLAGHCS